MIKRRIFSFTLALIFIMSIGTSAFAAEWYLEDGSIDVIADASGQTVIQGDVSQQDSAPVITQRDSSTPTDNTIDINAWDGATANVTIQDINIERDNGGTFIDVNGTAGDSVVLTVKGDNLLVSTDISGEDDAIVEVEDENLTIKGDGTLTIIGDTGGAKIGSDEGSDLSGSLHITDNVTIITSDDGSGDGAAIGSGESGDFTGSITIDGNAKVTAISNDRGAGIGSGEGNWIYYEDTEEEEILGDFRGTITIGGNATVYAEGDDDSAGIGSGEDGSFSGGSITIQDNANVYAEGSGEGPGIGAADDTSLNGSITIKDNANVTVKPGDESPVGIGSEGSVTGNGSISILGNASVNSYEGELRIGGEFTDNEYIPDDYGGHYSDNQLNITISDTATINGYSGAGLKAVDGVLIIAEAKAHALSEASVVFFEVSDAEGSHIPFTQELKDGVLTVKADADKAVLRGNRQAILLLMNYGVESIRFITNGAESELELEELAEFGSTESEVVLSHEGSAVSLTVDGEDAKKLFD